MSKVRKDDISHFHVNPKLRLAELALKTEFPTVSIDKDMEFYIRTLANRDSNVTGETQDASESSFITAEIFRHAKNTVKIYCPTLTDELPNLHDAFYLELRNFLTAGKTLKIALQNSENPKSAFNDILVKYAKNTPAKVQIKLANDNFHKNMDDILKKRTSFVVDDRNAFRFELLTSRKPFQKIHDLYSFNNKEISEELDAAFDDELFSKCPRLI